MKQTVLNLPVQTASRKLSLCAALCVLAAAVTLGVNVLLALTFTETTRLPYLLINIASDAIVGNAIILVLDTYLLPRRKLLCLVRQKGSAVTALVDNISESHHRYLGFDCLEIAAEGRRLFLPCDTIRLETGVRYRFQTVSNVIVEAER